MAPSPIINLPYEIENVTSEEDKIIKKCMKGYTRRFVKCGPHGYIMPGQFRKHAEAIYNFEVRPDDIWVITFPRSGTTWTQELVWLLQNDLNYKAAKDQPLHERFPMLETTTIIPEIATELIKINFMNFGNFQGLDKAARYPSWKRLSEMPSPRLIKTHLPLSLLPPSLLSTAKVLYVARDPRDVIVSYYYLHKMFAKNLVRLQFKHFWEAFRQDLLPWTPLIAHTNEAWKQRHNPNLHFVFYENMLKDLPKEIGRICDFLGKHLTVEEITTLSNHLSFDSFKKNKNINNAVNVSNTEGAQFVRKGEAGGWKNHFDEKMEIQAEEYLSSKLRGLDLQYPSVPQPEITHL